MSSPRSTNTDYSTSSDDLCNRAADPTTLQVQPSCSSLPLATSSSTRNRAPSAKRRPIPRHSRQKPKLCHSDVMKRRSLQRKNGQKRSLATLKTVSPPTKRVRGKDDTPGVDSQDQPSSVPRRSSNGCAVNEDAQRPQRTEGSHPTGAPDSNVGGSQNQVNGGSHSPLTSDAVLAMMKASEKRVLKHVVSHQRVLLAQVESLESLLKDLPKAVGTLKADVSDLKLMVLPRSDACSSQRNSSRSRPCNQTKDSALRQEVVEANPTLPAEFKSDVGSVSAVKAIADQMLKFHTSSEAVSMTARCMNIFLYGFQKEMKKSAAKEGIGFRHAEFRFKVARLMMEQAKTVPEDLFVVQEAENGENGAVIGAAVSRKPSWLTSDLLDANTMMLARKHNECLKSELPPYPSSPEKSKALFIAKSIYSNVIGMLRYSREKNRIRMFEDGTYCLLDWEQLKWFLRDLRNPELSFLWPQAKVIEASEVSETTVGDLANVRSENSELLQSFIARRKEMFVEAIYDVHVTKIVARDDGEKEEVTEIRRLRRVVNILRIANSFMCSFCHMSEQDVLRTHSATLQILYRIALVIREMFGQKIYGRSFRMTGSEVDATQRSQQPRTGDAAVDRDSVRMSDSRRDDISDRNEVANRDMRSNNSAPPERMCDDERLSRRRDSRETLCGPPNARKKTPPITVKGLIPADSERDRILQNILKLSVEAYKKLHAPDQEEAQRTTDNLEDVSNSSSNNGDPDERYESEGDDMSDMFD